MLARLWRRAVSFLPLAIMTVGCTGNPVLQAKAALTRGRDALEKQEFDRAIKELSESIRLQPKEIAPYIARAEAAAGKQDYQQAIADYDAAIGLDASRGSLFLERGRMWEAKGDTRKAMEDYTQAIQRDPALVRAYEQRGLLRFREGDTAGASSDFDSLVLRAPKSALGYWLRGRMNQSAEKYAAAIPDLVETTRLDPRNGEAQAMAAIAFLLEDKPGPAKQHLFDAESLAFGTAPTLTAQGVAALQAKDVDRALERLNAALKLEPDRADALEMRARVWDAKDEPAKALADRRQAAAAVPGVASIRRRCAAGLLRAGDAKAALVEADAALKINPKSAEGLDLAAACHAALGDFAKAVEMQESAVQHVDDARLADFEKRLEQYKLKLK